MRCKEFSPYKTLIQFNDLVFDSYDMISNAEIRIGTKQEGEEYQYGHGSYTNFLSDELFLDEQDLSITINFSYRRFSREDRKFIKDFLKMNLIRHGRLWAIEDNKLIWSYAYVTDYSEVYERYRGKFSVDVSFKLYEGIWHIADSKKTFLVPYTTCNFADCYDFRDINECLDCCLECNQGKVDCPECFCNCDVTKEDSFCMLSDDVLDKFLSCGKSYRILYDCTRAKQFFGELLGKKLCKEDICDGLLAGRFYSNTILNATEVVLHLEGNFHDPIIKINGNPMEITGDYNGYLKISSNWDVYFKEDLCCPWKDVDIDNVVVTKDFGFKVHHGENSVIVENACCPNACIYIDVDEITY